MSLGGGDTWPCEPVAAVADKDDGDVECDIGAESATHCTWILSATSDWGPQGGFQPRSVACSDTVT